MRERSNWGLYSLFRPLYTRCASQLYIAPHAKEPERNYDSEIDRRWCVGVKVE